jgi:hypothetical protein
MSYLQKIHSPTLDSVIMVEDLIKKRSAEYTKYQIWKKLPKKMMYQTYCLIFDYLLTSEKIIIGKDKKVLWLYDPKGILKILNSGVKIR